MASSTVISTVITSPSGTSKKYPEVGLGEGRHVHMDQRIRRKLLHFALRHAGHKGKTIVDRS